MLWGSNKLNISAFLIIFLLCSSCKSIYREFRDFEITKYSTLEKNVQLAKDIISYDLYDALTIKTNNLETSDCKDIHKGIFISENKKVVFVRIILNNNNSRVLSNKEIIYNYLREKINKLANLNYKHKNDFSYGFKIASKWFDLIELKKYDKAWQMLDADTIMQITKKNFICDMSFRLKELGGLRIRRESIRQYHTNLQKMKGDFMLLQFLCKYEKQNKVYENITFRKRKNEWKISGFHFESY